MPAEIWWEPGETRKRSGSRRVPDKTLIHIANAKALCQQCGALEPCRAWALSLLATADPLVGVVVGGLDTEERRQIAIERELEEAS
jgi:hypothetical protein